MDRHPYYPYRRGAYGQPRYVQPRAGYHPYGLYQPQYPGFGFYDQYDQEPQGMFEDEDEENDHPQRNPYYRHPRKEVAGGRQRRPQKGPNQQRTRDSPAHAEKTIPVKVFPQSPQPQSAPSRAQPASTTSRPANSPAPSSSANRSSSSRSNRDACFVGSRSVLEEQQERIIEEADLSTAPPEHELTDSSSISSKSTYCYYDDDDSEVEDVWIEEQPSQPHQQQKQQEQHEQQEPASTSIEACVASFTRELDLLAAVGLTDRAVVLPLLVEQFGNQGTESLPVEERQRKLQAVLTRLLLSSTPAQAQN